MLEIVPRAISVVSSETSKRSWCGLRMINEAIMEISRLSWQWLPGKWVWSPPLPSSLNLPHPLASLHGMTQEGKPGQVGSTSMQDALTLRTVDNTAFFSTNYPVSSLLLQQHKTVWDTANPGLNNSTKNSSLSVLGWGQGREHKTCENRKKGKQTLSACHSFCLESRSKSGPHWGN